ncbi:hypothetical protein BT69DRAFT_1281568, partial [Atractiella rhizophila]
QEGSGHCQECSNKGSQRSCPSVKIEEAGKHGVHPIPRKKRNRTTRNSRSVERAGYSHGSGWRRFVSSSDGLQSRNCYHGLKRLRRRFDKGVQI